MENNVSSFEQMHSATIREIRSLEAILNGFATDKEFDEMLDTGITISTGIRSANFIMTPFTWELLEEMISRTIAYLIVDNEMQDNPVYHKKLIKYLKTGNLKMSDFDGYI